MERTREHKKREDYRQGGRVQLARGKGVKPKKKKKAKVAKTPKKRPQPRPQQPQATQATIPPAEQKAGTKINRLAIEEPVGEPRNIP